MKTYRGVPVKPPGTHPLRGVAFDVAAMPAQRRALWRRVEEAFEQPFRGITTDGRVMSGLRELRDDGFAPGPLKQAVTALLDLLSPDQRGKVLHAVDAPHWRRWTNAFATWSPHGLLLSEADQSVRDAVVDVLRTSLSDAGVQATRDCMRLNETLAELVEDNENLGEWTYRFAVYGTPSSSEPWGWQLHGHHVDLHFLAVGRQACLSPVFLGAEPCVADGGVHAGVRAFDDERRRGLDVVQGLSGGQLDRAVLFGSMRTADLPPQHNHPTEGRHRGGAGQDNLVLPYEGLPASAMSAPQRDSLLRLAQVYVDRWPAGTAAGKMREIDRHLDETHFAWIGATHDDAVFYYRVHSPVILIEFDHHAGIFLDNPDPEPFHVHTIVRTPNGGDYGRDLLRLHYARHHAGPPPR